LLKVTKLQKKGKRGIGNRQPDAFRCAKKSEKAQTTRRERR
jgi:hypothetical protein